MGALTDQLDATPDRAERRRLRTLAHTSLPSFAGQSVTRGPFTITVLEGPTAVDLAGTPAVRLVLRFVNAGADVTPADFNPWLIVNPPILVPDPAGDVVRADTDPLGNPVSRRFREDPAAALRELVRDQARTVFRS